MKFIGGKVGTVQRQVNIWQIKKVLLPILIIGLAFIGMVFGVRHFTKDHTLGFDFYLYWNSSRLFIFDGLNPYSEETAVQNQIGIIGSSDLQYLGPYYFRNPVYSMIPIIPLTIFDYSWAQSIWVAINVFSVFACFYFALPALPKWMIVLFVFFYQISFGLIQGNFSLMAGLSILLAIGIIIFQGKHDFRTQVIIGFLLSISSFKPQLSWFFLIFILIYAYKQRLYPMIISFLGTLL